MAFTSQQTKRDISCFNIDIAQIENFIQTAQEKPLGGNWPVVYLLHNDTISPKLLYIGETTSLYRRMTEHFSRSNRNYDERSRLNMAHVIFDQTFNKSAVLDIEQELIHMFSADSSGYKLQNRNDGQSSQHQYYDREDYITSLKEIWDELRRINMAKDSFDEVRNSNLFKYSPFTALTAEQEECCAEIVDNIIDSICNGKDFNAVISGYAGTGKTVVLIKALSDLIHLANSPVQGNTATDKYDDTTEGAEQQKKRDEINSKISILNKARPGGLKVAYVVPLSDLLPAFKAVIKAVCGDDSIVKCATEVANTKEQYDVIFVDEAHRLGTINKFGSNKDPYKQACQNVGLEYTKGMNNPPTELDWIVSKSKNCVFVYDRNQKVRSHPSIKHKQFKDTVLDKNHTKVYTLHTQMRCRAGNKYEEFLDCLFCNRISSDTPLPPWKGYDFRVYDDVNQMIEDVNNYNRDGNCGLSRVVAGYGWKWSTKDKSRNAIKRLPSASWDIHLNGADYFWNAKNGNFIFKADPKEIGCVHTVQGFDLNYVGVIFGPEIKYDSQKGFIIDENNIYDTGTTTRDKAELLELTIRAYKVMMERGIRGCYVYACDPDLQEYLKKYVPSPDKAKQSLDIKVNGTINQLTGLQVSSNGHQTIENEVQLNKADVDAAISGSGNLKDIKTITIDNMKHNVKDISLSEDEDYYVVTIE